MNRQRQSSAALGSGGSRAAPVVVVGAGMAGLAGAIDLARQGQEVLLLERAGAPGGKLRETRVAGRAVDSGPTVLTMRWVFDALFDAAGTTLDAHLGLRAAETLARHAWNGDERLDLFADIDRSADAIDAFSGNGEGRRYRDFCARAAATYRTLEAPFIESSRPSPWSLAARSGWSGLPGLMRISPFTSLWNALGEHFRDPRLRQLFGRYATYCGSSPFDAAATLMLVAHVEQRGVWLVDGGMQRIADALASLAARLGVSQRYGTHVREIVVRDGRAVGVLVDDGDTASGATFIAADAVLFNGDVAALGKGLLGDGAANAASPVGPAQRSLSAITWNVVGRCDGFPLLRHNVFFGSNYRAEFDAIFRHGRVPDDPTVYVCALDRADAPVAATADERLLCLVNAPALGDSAPLGAREIAQCTQRMTRALQRCGLRIESDPSHRVTTTPSDFARLFPGSEGALYGRASHGWMASFSRPAARSRIAGLYLAGGTVHPGPGLPMAALSGRQAAASILADRAADRSSTARFLPRATPGGMSTP